MRDTTVIVGHKGMLGRAWCERLARAGRPHVGFDLGDIDITDPASVAARIGGDAAVVVNCAAYTAVDAAESDEAAATRVNGDAVGHLAARCRAVGATLVHYSTDYVFDGASTEPYPVDAPHDPVNAYGRSKAVGERRLFESGADWLLVRTSWVYAPWGKNFVRTIRKLALERPELKVIDDQRGRPTSAEHLADLSDRLLGVGARGVFHGTDGGECTWFGFAREIARLVGARCEVRPCTTADYPTPAARPRYSVLDLSATEARIGPLRGWRENLADVLARVED